MEEKLMHCRRKEVSGQRAKGLRQRHPGSPALAQLLFCATVLITKAGPGLQSVHGKMSWL